MPKYETTMLLTIAEIEAEYNIVVDYDYSVENHTVDIYEIYCIVSKEQPYIYLETLLTDKQYYALEAEILASKEQ